MMQILKNHKWAIILALTASIIVALPQLYLRENLKGDYRGMELFGMGDEIAWLSRVREAYDGHLTISNAYYKEGKNDPYTIQPLGSDIIAVLGRFFSLDINNTLLLSRFLFSFLVFLLIYGFVFVFTKKKMTALVVSTFLFLGNAFFNRSAIFKILAGLSPTLNYVNYTRPVNPLMTHFFFFGFLLFFWLFLETKKRRYGLLSALILGLSFYDYFYTWTFLYAFLGVLGMIYLIQKNWDGFKKIIIICVSAVFIALPYFYNVYQTTKWPNYLEVGERLGLVGNRSLTIGFLAPLLFVIVLLLFSRKVKAQYFFALSLVIAPFVALNQQMITGKVLQSSHYHWYFHIPLAVILLGIIFFDLVERLNRIKIIKIISVLIILASIGGAIFIQQRSYASHRQTILDQQKYGPLMAWLNQNTQKEEVVFANTGTAFFTVIYTPLNVFYHPGARYTLAGNYDRLLKTLFLYYRIDGVDADNVDQIFTADRGNIASALYGIYFRYPTGQEDYLPQEILDDLIQQYRESLNTPTAEFFKALLKEYGVQYLVWDTKENPSWLLDQYRFLEKKNAINDFSVYEFHEDFVN